MVFVGIREAQLASTNGQFKISNGTQFLSIFKCGFRFLAAVFGFRPILDAVFGFQPILDAVFGFEPFLNPVCGFQNPYNPPPTQTESHTHFFH